MNILTSVNLNQNEVQNVVIQNLAVAPSEPKEGQIYYDTAAKKLKTWDGEKWVDGGSDAPARMVGSVGEGGTVTDLPTSSVSVGDTYVVVKAGTYASQAAKVGDMFIANSSAPTWLYVPSGDDGNVYKYSTNLLSRVRVVFPNGLLHTTLTINTLLYRFMKLKVAKWFLPMLKQFQKTS